MKIKDNKTFVCFITEARKTCKTDITFFCLLQTVCFPFIYCTSLFFFPYCTSLFFSFTVHRYFLLYGALLFFSLIVHRCYFCPIPLFFSFLHIYISILYCTSLFFSFIDSASYCFTSFSGGEIRTYNTVINIAWHAYLHTMLFGLHIASYTLHINKCVTTQLSTELFCFCFCKDKTNIKW